MEYLSPSPVQVPPLVGDSSSPVKKSTSRICSSDAGEFEEELARDLGVRYWESLDTTGYGLPISAERYAEDLEMEGGNIAIESFKIETSPSPSTLTEPEGSPIRDEKSTTPGFSPSRPSSMHFSPPAASIQDSTTSPAAVLTSPTIDSLRRLATSPLLSSKPLPSPSPSLSPAPISNLIPLSRQFSESGQPSSQPHASTSRLSPEAQDPVSPINSVPSVSRSRSPSPLPPAPPPPDPEGFTSRSFRQRTAAQLKPYSIENAKYTRTMVKNGWQGAVVIGPRILEETEEQMRVRKEIAESAPKDNLGGWLEFEAGQRVGEGEKRLRRRDSDEESYDGDEMLEREARRKDFDEELEQAFGKRKNNGKGKEKAFIEEDDDRPRQKFRVPKQLRHQREAQQTDNQHSTSTSKKKRSRKSTESRPSNPRGFSSEGDSQSPHKLHRKKSRVARAGSEPPLSSSPAVTNNLHRPNGKSRNRPSKSLPVPRDRPPDKMSSLERQLLALPSPHRTTNVESSSAEEESESEGTVDSSSQECEVVEPKRLEKTKLGGKKKRALGMMMPAVFMKRAQADLKLMEREKLEGVQSGSDEGSGDGISSEDSESERRQRGRGIIKKGAATRKLDDFIHDKGVFTDESGDDGRLQDVDDPSSEEEEQDAVTSWLQSFGQNRQNRQGGHTEDIIDRLFKKAKTRRPSKSRSSRRKGVTAGGAGGRREDDTRVKSKSSKEKRSAPTISRTSDSHHRSEARSASAFNGHSSVKAVPLDTDQALFGEEPSFSRTSNVEVRQRVVVIDRLEPIDEVRPILNQVNEVETEQWATYSKFSHDFDIKKLPSGIQFPSTSFVGSGHLFNTVSPHLNDSAPARFCRPFAYPLDSIMAAAEIQALFPSLCDAIFSETIELSDWEEVNSTSDTLRFLGNYILEALPAFDAAVQLQFIAALFSQFDRLDLRLESHSSSTSEVNPTFDKRNLIISLYSFDLTARAIRIDSENITLQDRFSKTAKQLLDRLLSHGPQHTMKTLKSLLAVNSVENQLIVHDTSVEAWLALISIALSPEEGFNSFGSFEFWQLVTDGVIQALPDSTLRSPVGGERLSYTATMLCAISQFSPSGLSLSTPRLPSHWPILVKTLDLIQPSSLAKSDHTSTNTALARRDRYLWTLFGRTLVFMDRWNWQVGTKDDLVPKLFDLVNARRLSDLTIETDNDFPSFLQKIEQLDQPMALELQDTTFIIFLKVLVKTASFISHEPPNEQRRQLTRLFLRLSPMTSGPWTRTSSEIVRGGSILINHYSLYMTFAALSPGGAGQRLDQAKRLLNFIDIDEIPRRIAIRAILYFTLIFRRNNIPINPLVEYLSTLAKQLRTEYTSLEREFQTKSRGNGRIDEGQGSKRAGKTALWNRAVLLTMVLRSVQLVLRWKGTDLTSEPFPELQLLHPAWTTQLLESPLALDPMIGREILRCIDCFLDIRASIVSPTRLIEEINTGVSQDEFGMFEMDYEDPALNAMLGVEMLSQSNNTAQNENKLKDIEFAKFISTSLSPSIFRLLSNIYVINTHGIGAGPTVADRTAYAELVVECWTRCIAILVQHDLTDWSSYLRYGDNSWRRLGDPIGRREIALLLTIHLSKYDSSFSQIYQDEFLDIWFQTIVYPKLVNQSSLTSILLNIATPSILFSEIPFVRSLESNKFEISLEELKAGRNDLLRSIIQKAGQILRNPSQTQSSDKSLSNLSVLNLIRAMLSSISDNLSAMSQESERREYSIFVKFLLEEIKKTESLNEKNLTGLKGLLQAVA